MRSRHYLFPALALPLLLCAAALADPPALKIEAEIKPQGQYATFTPGGDAVAVTYVGLSGVDPLPSAILKDGRMFVLDTRGLAEGRYKFVAVAAGKTGEQARADFVVVVGVPPPVPPGPGPGPNPPDPKPPTPPDPAPIPAAGLSALIVYESETLSALPRPQLEILNATGPGSVREYLTTHCIKGPDGRTPECRFLDKDASTAGESKFWQDALALKRGPELPWLMVTNGKAGYSGPLPATPAATLDILKKYGGQ